MPERNPARIPLSGLLDTEAEVAAEKLLEDNLCHQRIHVPDCHYLVVIAVYAGRVAVLMEGTRMRVIFTTGIQVRPLQLASQWEPATIFSTIALSRNLQQSIVRSTPDAVQPPLLPILHSFLLPCRSACTAKLRPRLTLVLIIRTHKTHTSIAISPKSVQKSVANYNKR